MKNLFTLDKLKYVAAGAIVLTAFLIVLPDVKIFAFKLATVATITLTVVVLSALIAFGWHFLSARQKSVASSSDNAQSDTRSNS